MLQCCPNGDREPVGAAADAMTPAGLAATAGAAVAAGAAEFHLHPRDSALVESMTATAVASAVGAIREAVPGVPVGVTTAAWIEPDPRRRRELIRGWTVLPDYASVNWHEDDAEGVARALLDRGIGVEAGIFVDADRFVDAAATFVRSPLAGQCRRILIEVVEQDPARMREVAHRALGLVADLGVPILLHGEDPSCWPMVEIAVLSGVDTRIGLEDTLLLPDGETASDNADLVRAAVRLGAR